SQSWQRQERLAAVASLAGTTQSWYVEPGEPPSILLHGTKDTTVPYSAAKSFCQTAATRTDCQLVTYTGGHGITPDGDWSDLREQLSTFFYEKVLVGLGFTTEINPLGASSTIHPVTPTRMV